MHLLYIKSSRNRIMVVLENQKFYFSRHLKKSNETKWRCYKNTCPAKIFVDIENPNVVKRKENEHNHIDVKAKIGKDIFFANCKNQALTNISERPINILKNSLKEVPTEITAKDIIGGRKLIYRTRKKQFPHAMPLVLGELYQNMEKRKEREQKNRAETLVTPDDIEKRKNDEQGLSSDPLDTTENIEKRKNDEQGLSSDPLDTTENIEIPIEEIKIEEIKIEETEILSEDDPGLDYGPSTSINSTLILPGTSSKNNFDFEEKIKSIKKEEVECAEDLPIAPIEFNVAGFSCMQLKPNKRKRSCSSDRAASASLVEDSQNTASDDDALDLTGKIIANKLRRFPKKVRIIAEKLLNDVLYLAELGNLNENSMIVTKHC